MNHTQNHTQNDFQNDRAEPTRRPGRARRRESQAGIDARALWWREAEHCPHDPDEEDCLCWTEPGWDFGPHSVFGAVVDAGGTRYVTDARLLIREDRLVGWPSEGDPDYPYPTDLNQAPVVVRRVVDMLAAPETGEPVTREFDPALAGPDHRGRVRGAAAGLRARRARRGRPARPARRGVDAPAHPAAPPPGEDAMTPAAGSAVRSAAGGAVGGGVEFYLGTHQPGWLSWATVPLFVSDRRLRRYRRLPKARTRWALDSGGFTELSTHGSWDHGPTPAPVRGLGAPLPRRDRVLGVGGAAGLDV